MFGKLFGQESHGSTENSKDEVGSNLKETVLLCSPSAVTVTGNYKKLPATGVAQLVSSSAQRAGGKVTQYFLIVGKEVRLPLQQAMDLDPPLEQVLAESPLATLATLKPENRGDGKEFNVTLSLVAGPANKPLWVTLKLPSPRAMQAWHKALRDCIASLVFSPALVLDLHNRLSLAKIEVALKRCEALVPPTHKVCRCRSSHFTSR